jgi:hypothetical protein
LEIVAFQDVLVVLVAWKNFLSGWAGYYKGKEKRPTMVLEAVASQNLCILWNTWCPPSK